MSFEYPFFQPWLVLVHGQVPVLGFLQYRHFSTQHRLGLDKVGWAKRRAAGLALVTICFGITTVGASALYIAVSQELLRLGIIILFDFLFFKQPFIIHAFENSRSCFILGLGSNPNVNIKTYSEIMEGLSNQLMVFVSYFLRGYAFFFCSNGNGHTMFIRTTNKGHIDIISS